MPRDTRRNSRHADQRQPQALSVSFLLAALAGVLMLVFLPGCATVDSDIPWNEPQAWEGSPYIPGLSGQ